MANYTDHVPLRGSERVTLSGAKAIGAADPDESIRVTVLLRSRAQAEDARTKTTTATTNERSAVTSLLQKRAADRQHLTREQFLAQRGGLEEDVRKVEEFAHEYGLSISDTNLAKGSLILSGTVANFSKAFNVELRNYTHADGTYRGRTGAIHIPTGLEGIITAVLGLDNRPQARPHFRTRRTAITSHALTAQPAGTFTPVQIANVYDFPAGADGTGQCIGIIELGGGYKSRDIRSYFKSLNLTAPKVVAVSVDGGHNKPPGDPSGDDGEVMLDIEVAGAVAPKATLAVYFAPNTDQGFYDAIAAAVHDTRHNPSVISISWGGPESSWTQQSLTEFNTLLEDAATLGLTVCVASGDNGSTDGQTDGLQHVDFPASSPYALACGGTNLTANADGTYGSETVWNEMANQEGAGGGGVSDFFAKPSYQSSVNVPASLNPGNFVGRGVPDVSGDADPVSGYDVLVDGQASVIGGTSAVAPLWAGLIACLNQILGKSVGSLTSLVYTQIAPAGNTFHDITTGDNGSFSATTGWDACTGFGSPIGSAIASALTGKSAAKN